MGTRRCRSRGAPSPGASSRTRADPFPALTAISWRATEKQAKASERWAWLVGALGRRYDAAPAHFVQPMSIPSHVHEMNRLLIILCFAAVPGCSRGSADRESAVPRLMDVSGDDCTASVLVYDKPPAEANPPEDPGTPFINDGCWGKRIFLGINGERRELTRAEDVPLGLGGPYSDDEYRVLVQRARTVSRVELTEEDGEISCEPPRGRKYDVVYEMDVRIWSAEGSWSIDGATYGVECGP
jgi:hypothetical protein